MVVLLALLAAFLFAVGTVFQQKADMEEADDAALKADFLLRLVRRPVWLLGLAGTLLGAVVQAIALAIGRLVIIQPLLVTSIVFALPLGWRFTGQRIGRREVTGALAVTAGLAAFVAISDPSGGKDDAPFREWLVAGAIGFGITIALTVAGFGRRPGVKAALVGTASGILFGFGAALTKATVDQLQDGIVALVADWHLYALIGTALPAFWLTQVALQTGALAPAIATTMTFDPVASLLLGTFLLDEQLSRSGVRVAVLLGALLVTLAGLIVLARAQARERPSEIALAPRPALTKG